MATTSYPLANQALKGLRAVTDVIAEDNMEAAERVLDALLACFEFLAENSEA